MKQRFIIHDLSGSALSAEPENTIIVPAVKKAAPCKGCFCCWLKTPGECIMHDGLEQTGSKLISSSEVVIISRSLYGGFSRETKQVLDRCIGGVLPFFSRRSGKMHHMPRYETRAHFQVIFYDCDSMTPNEKILAKRIAEAVATNFNASSCDVSFLPGDASLEEVLSE